MNIFRNHFSSKQYNNTTTAAKTEKQYCPIKEKYSALHRVFIVDVVVVESCSSSKKNGTTNNLISWHAFLSIQLCVLGFFFSFFYFLAIWPEISHWINIIAVNVKEKRQRIWHNPSLSLSLACLWIKLATALSVNFTLFTFGKQIWSVANYKRVDYHKFVVMFTQFSQVTFLKASFSCKKFMNFFNFEKKSTALHPRSYHSSHLVCTMVFTYICMWFMHIITKTHVYEKLIDFYLSWLIISGLRFTIMPYNLIHLELF